MLRRRRIHLSLEGIAIRLEDKRSARTVLSRHELRVISRESRLFLMANKRRRCYASPMSVRSCRVTIRDLDGIDHTVHVTASTLYEAVALGLASLRGEEWVAGVAEGPNTVSVAVTNVAVEHRVAMKDFRAWLDRPPRSPRDVAQRVRVREILGASARS